MKTLEIIGVTECGNQFRAIQYWEDAIWEKHLAEPVCNRWKPYYVCYVW